METNGRVNLSAEIQDQVPINISDDKLDKIATIAFHFRKIMETLELNLEDPGLRDTPERVAKLYINEAFKGLDESNFPKISFFGNHYKYDEMILIKDITLYSYCEHHFVPFFGKVSIAYYPTNRVIGLSKINRIVQFIASKPHVQEKLTMELGTVLMNLLHTDDIAISIEAKHLCVASRGVSDTNSLTNTNFFSGKFRKGKVQNQYLKSITH
ncbi:GTP cyclohydrolase I FolE [Arenibacter sp. M-2]|uniref:GTP cyclohydrolase I FolE n=1 Tax=Arenibacter sp. M-2 TaxID=3053612 RepID=UPI0025711C75|nr:GTP cyclohydrolase I FolE [Arenibacter sp. M-2]MDL5512024.1 GTP cyclohydrolase I FolE [Arenibacter sp. M-2]